LCHPLGLPQTKARRQAVKHLSAAPQARPLLARHCSCRPWPSPPCSCRPGPWLYGPAWAGQSRTIYLCSAHRWRHESAP